ncbi:MAG: bifunctional glutamate N-acetyltransferase/amino-acid acetyltransferase ArgJ [Candidatus Zapsychrus exili]|nr:bifunctional glutamate N-acetyltransferase/amino-acid acetyltransferase ArgJ [Candidatus Zapsychrus exili]
MKIIKGGVTKPQGYKASGISCGIKRSGKLDLGLIASDCATVSVGVFTKSSVKAAPLVISQKHIKNNKIQAIIVNSGNANCFTGKFGLAYADKTTEIIGKLLNISKKDVIVSSTGIIGKPLPFKKIKNASKKLVQNLSKSGSERIAKSILTTDKKTKQSAVQINLRGKKVYVGACAKGSGMIAPNMATMLAFVTTDAAINANMLKIALKKANDESFNCISVDGCMSTNDMVIVMANGLAKNKKITKAGADFKKLCKAINYICLDLAKKIVLDGEGATKFINIEVMEAKNKKQAQKAALQIANSVLVKTAAYGSNPNWGRIAAAVGSLGISKITENNLKIVFSSFKEKEIKIIVDLGLGKASASAYTCDLSLDYVRINGKYN